MNWCGGNKLFVNISKTDFMIFKYLERSERTLSSVYVLYRLKKQKTIILPLCSLFFIDIAFNFRDVQKIWWIAR